jgi:hypothetical protein
MIVSAAAMAILMVMMMVVLLMIVSAAAMAILMVMMMVMVLLMIVSAAAMAILMVMMMVMVLLVMVVTMATMMIMLCQILRSRILTLHRLQQLCARQLAPRGRNQRCRTVVLSEQRHSGIQLCLRNGIRAGKDDGGSGLNLVVIEFAEVLHVNLNLACISNGNRAAQHNIVSGHLLNSSNHVRQFAHTGRFNHDPIRMIALNNLHQSLAEIAHQTAADAAGIHFRNIDTGILQKTAVNSDLAELVLDQNQLFTAVAFLNHFLDQSRLSGAKKAGVNIDNCHYSHLLYYLMLFIIPRFHLITSIFIGKPCNSFHRMLY